MATIRRQGSSPCYSIATGCSDGILKLWKMSSTEVSFQSKEEALSWVLVGMFRAHPDAVSSVSFSSCGRKIATACHNGPQKFTWLHIWDALCWAGNGSFVLEDAIALQGEVVNMSWICLGNGQLMLGVCLPNELRIYALSRSHQNMLHAAVPKERHVWQCIAFSYSCFKINDFLWGPRVIPMLVHRKHISFFVDLYLRANQVQNNISSVRKIASTFPRDTKFDGVDTNKDHCLSCQYLSQEQDTLDSEISSLNLLDIADQHGGSLPIYHPHALCHHLYQGSWEHAHIILQHLVQSLKVGNLGCTCSTCGKSSYHGLEIPLSAYFMDKTSTTCSSKELRWGDSNMGGVSGLQAGGNNVVQNVESWWAAGMAGIDSENSEKMSFTEIFEKNNHFFAHCNINKIQLLALFDLVTEIADQTRTSPFKTLDEAGRRFWISVQLQRHCYHQKFGLPCSAEAVHVESDSIAWALQSDCQDDLLNSILSAESTWLEMRNLGVGVWYTNIPQLRIKMEKLARMQYLKRKDPRDCALLYVALNRIQLLAGLFKISKDEKDKSLSLFLSRNFQEEKNKAAALKNAYILMGRHQLEFAAAFFLLGGDHWSALSICAKNLGDEQLALLLCRLIEGFGGTLEHDLISNVLLPNAEEKGDFWLSSILEWLRGNFSQSVQNLFGSRIVSSVKNKVGTLCYAVLSDPQIGQHCALLATKNNFKNFVGEASAIALHRFSLSISAGALKRCGFPLEALDCLSSSMPFEHKVHRGVTAIKDHDILQAMLNPFHGSASNWMSESLAQNTELKFKEEMASSYLSRLVRSLLPCPQCLQVPIKKDENSLSIGELARDIDAAASIFEKKYSASFVTLVEQILVFASNNRVPFFPILLLWAKNCLQDGAENSGPEISSCSDSAGKFLLNMTRESCYFTAKFVASSYLANFTLNLDLLKGDAPDASDFCKHYLTCLRKLLNLSRALLRQFDALGYLTDNSMSLKHAIVLLGYYVEFSFCWLIEDLNGLIIMSGPIFDCSESESGFSTEFLIRVLDRKNHESSDNQLDILSFLFQRGKNMKVDDSTLSLDERWIMVGASMWLRFSAFAKNHFSSPVEVNKIYKESKFSTSPEFFKLLPSLIISSLMTSLDFISSTLVRHLYSYFSQKILSSSHSNAILWLEKFCLSSTHDYLGKEHREFQVLNTNNKEMLLDFLFKMLVNAQDICDGFMYEEVPFFQIDNRQLHGCWHDLEKHMVHVAVTKASGTLSSPRTEMGEASGLPAGLHGPSGKTLKYLSIVEELRFSKHPKELVRRSGELLEAVCFNSTNEQQVAVASNQKGLIFFEWDKQGMYESNTKYIWSDSEWPQAGWAGCESTPVPTYVSPGIGLGNKKGAHLGLGGAIVGPNTLAKTSWELTGGGAFGVSGYAGIGSSGLGWGELEKFENLIEPPATVVNICCQALSQHPSMALLLAGSSNTHIYLWEFGKDRAVATYGVLPAPNVPPPYSLASVSAVKFDRFGHRFASAALDGTVCTWQLEVGGRSNVYPVDSALCFNSHASDVDYISASGSIIAAAGLSSNGANLVVWDTLAPPTFSQSSVVCHEGGVCSLSAFSDNVGSSSMAHMIVAGGKGGDVSVHDFRFLKAGKTKYRKYGDASANADGMVWHIPKAHAGSVNAVATVPNTSFFLTGSKDGDVKLWDAKYCQLLFQWHKLHDRHTFFQANSKSFTGVVRAAVMDIQVLPHGFLTCGGDGSVKLIELNHLLL